MPKQVKKSECPLEGLDGQLMIGVAHRYCLGRQTYIVGSCIDWLKKWWGKCEGKTRVNIVRDTVRALQEGEAGSHLDYTDWKAFAEWAWTTLDDESKRWCKDAVRYADKPWPLKEEEK
jgi:hypothetical protein